MLKIIRFLSNKYIFCFPMMQMFACPYLFMFFSFIYQIILPYRQRIKNGGNIPKNVGSIRILKLITLRFRLQIKKQNQSKPK